MEVVQKKQSGKGLNWEATFPDDTSWRKIRSFLQRVVFIIASHILRIRDLLPAKCFKKRQIEKWKFYVIRAEGEGGDVVHSLKGVMEAIEFAYIDKYALSPGSKRFRAFEKSININRRGT
ncbi:hypothetical protein ACH3XW_16595 [Acanthocheilonema viteae]